MPSERFLANNKRKARDISNVEGSQEVLRTIADQGDSDGKKYQYAVELAREDLDGDTSDTDEFRNLVDDYYAQMDPETSAEDMRGETGFTQAVRGVGEFVDNTNDFLGDGIDWLWDNTAGNLAGGVGGLVGAFANNADLGEQWKQGVSDVISPETADAIASAGTGMLVAALPGIGVPLSIGLTAAQNSDDLYEAMFGVDAVTRESLSDTERLGRAGSAILDTALAAMPAIGKAGRYIRGGRDIDDVARASTAALKEGGKDAYKKSGELLSTSMKLGSGTATQDEARAALEAVADMAKKNKDTGLGAAVTNVSNAVRDSPLNIRNNLRQFVDSVSDTGGMMRNTQRNANAANIMDAARAGARKTGKQAKKEAVEALGENATGPARFRAGNWAGLKQYGKNRVNDLLKGAPVGNGLIDGVIGSLPLSYMNYMAETGDSDIRNALANIGTNPANFGMLLAPGILRRTPGVRNLYGALGIQGRGGAGTPSASIRSRMIGNNQKNAEDPAYGYEEFMRRLRTSGSDR